MSESEYIAPPGENEVAEGTVTDEDSWLRP